MGAIAQQTVALVMKAHRGPRAHPDFPVPGEGEVDFARILRSLRAAGFAGPLSVERVDGTDRGPIPAHEVDARLARARRNLERLLAEVGS